MAAKEPSILWDLAQVAIGNSNRWFGDIDAAQSIPHMTLALCGEVGELANIIKKIDRGDLDPSSAKVRMDMSMELADVLTYVLNLSALLKIDLLRAYEQKCIENEHRFMELRRKRETND